MSLCTPKKTAIVQLCNCISLSSSAISNIKQLSTGVFFVNTINNVFPEFLKDEDKSEGTAVHCDEDANVISETTDAPEAAKADPGSDNSVVNVELPGAKDIIQKFKFVQKFIDEYYVLKSEEIITYNQCVESNELELAKVAIFVLSEVVRHLVHVKSDQLQTLSHLDINVQEDLEECFNHFIAERFKISKSETERILSHPANYKVINSPKKSSFVTPQRRCSSKYKKNLPTSTPSNEDVFTNSPLKSFFESPIFRKEDIFAKYKEELGKTRRALFEEEQKREDLEFELKEVKKVLIQKDKEIQNLKQDVAQANENYQSLLSSECSNKACKEKFEKEQARFKTQSNALFTEITSLYSRLSRLQSQQNSDCGSSKSERRTPIPNIDELIELKLREKDAEIISLKEEVHELKQCVDALKDFSADRWMLSENTSSLREEPVTPVVDENVGDIIKEDYKQKETELKEARLQINKLIEENMKLRKRIQNKQDQSSSRNMSNHLSTSKLSDINNVNEKEKLRSVRRSDSVKEFISLPTECSPLSSSVRQRTTSTMSEGEPSSENISEAVLWRRYKSESQLENCVSTDCMDIENDLSMGRDASAIKCEDADSNSSIRENIQEDCVPENAAKTDSASVKEDLILELDIHTILSCLGLSTNGSYKNEIKDVKKLQAGLTFLRTLPNGSNGRELRVFLKIRDLLIPIKNKCSDGTDMHLGTGHASGTSYSRNEIEAKELKHQLSEKISLLRQKEDELHSLKSEYDSLWKKYQTTVQEKDQLHKTSEDYLEKFKQLKQRYKEVASKYNDKRETSKMLSLKYNQLEEGYRSLKEKHQLLSDRYEAKSFECKNFAKKELQCLSLSSRLGAKEKEVRVLQEKLEAYKSKNVQLEKTLKEYQLAECDLKNMIEILKIKRSQMDYNMNTAKDTINSLIKTRGLSQQITGEQTEEPSSSHNSMYVLPKFLVTPHDQSNGSILSGALCRKTPFVLENQDEEDYLNHSSLYSMKEKPEEDRVEELKRRNSILPIHLQSSYPTEVNLPLPLENLYVKNSLNEKNSTSQENTSGSSSRKRKLEEKIESRNNVNKNNFKTPTRLNRYTVRTPASLKKMFRFKSRSNRTVLLKKKQL